MGVGPNPQADAPPGGAVPGLRTTDRTTGTRLPTRGPHLPGHTRCRHRAGPALFAPANWTPIRGYGRYSSCLFASPHTSAERHRGSVCRRTLTLPSPQGLPASPKQTSDTFTPRVLGRTRPLGLVLASTPRPFLASASECTNMKFFRVTDRVLYEHLQGEIVAGVYPLVEGDRCYFVVVDFDGAGWQQDVRAFASTARDVGLPVTVERSRSGNGAHAWFFFAAAVSASAARQLASYVLTEAMSRRSEIGMQSYDRLFSNQDTLPHGGFGNLIALPLQWDARQYGNSVFVNDLFADGNRSSSAGLGGGHGRWRRP